MRQAYALCSSPRITLEPHITAFTVFDLGDKQLTFSHITSCVKMPHEVTHRNKHVHTIIIIIISIQPEGRVWQEPEPSQATGMALAHCILGSFLGVGCHCFPPPLDVLTFASKCLHVQAS